MKFKTARFGEIDFNAEDIIEFPEGPAGFPDFTKFVIIEKEKELPYRTLQSLDDPVFAFVIIDPLLARADYKIDVTQDDLKRLKTASIKNLEIYVIVNMSRDPDKITVNLRGPIIINREEGLGHQFNLSDSTYSIKEKLSQEKA
jgi:flagellar assembly factor FliW